MRIEVRNLKKYFGKTRAVDDISFSFAAGQVVGFVDHHLGGVAVEVQHDGVLEQTLDADGFAVRCWVLGAGCWGLGQKR